MSLLDNILNANTSFKSYLDQEDIKIIKSYSDSFDLAMSEQSNCIDLINKTKSFYIDSLTLDATTNYIIDFDKKLQDAIHFYFIRKIELLRFMQLHLNSKYSIDVRCVPRSNWESEYYHLEKFKTLDDFISSYFELVNENYKSYNLKEAGVNSIKRYFASKSTIGYTRNNLSLKIQEDCFWLSHNLTIDLSSISVYLYMAIAYLEFDNVINYKDKLKEHLPMDSDIIELKKYEVPFETIEYVRFYKNMQLAIKFKSIDAINKFTNFLQAK